MKKYLTFLFCIVLINTSLFAGEIDSLLVQLETIMKARGQYQIIKEIELNGLKKLLHEAKGKPDEMYYVTTQIIQEYIPFTFDSALHYINQNLVLSRLANNARMLNETRLLLSQILSSSGQYKESLDVLADVNRGALTREMLVDYYSSYWKVYSELAYYSVI